MRDVKYKESDEMRATNMGYEQGAFDFMDRESASRFEEQFRQTTLFGGTTS